MAYREGPQTRRLLHRAFDLGDAEAFFRLNSDQEVMKFTGEPLLSSLKQASEAIECYTDFERYGFGRWACVEKQSGRVIGFSGLKYLPDLDEVDVGYRLMPEFWGRGFATEACAACLEFGFRTLQLKEIIAMVIPANAASIGVVRKCGMRCEGEVSYEGIPVLRFVKTNSSPSVGGAAV
ncbi:GNAT family N-acetyltransferase [Crateriforma conspicua]|uniref:Spermidine N(1)-acetyltransferase n=1 Tax=Crateriforma conspicua TaxID=2527996 RepID=A0A5C5YDS1_9PLAN|nr:GNAT family N-acetyltransferase [Crateriforma conspicua]TWT72591.1 Spermidine N(1)-acetyltransferase [Crateriforma conspicua]